jgi:uncharacterized protein (DUF2147 family)
MMRSIISSLLLLLLFGSFSAVPLGVSQVAEGDRILGIWEPSEKKGRVKIEKIGSRYYGKIIWLKEPLDEQGSAKVDHLNPDANLRQRPRLGLRLMQGFVYSGNGVWEEGTIYDPDKGKTYCGKIVWVSGNELQLRGHVCGLKFLGRSDTWTRYSGDLD